MPQSYNCSLLGSSIPLLMIFLKSSWLEPQPFYLAFPLVLLQHQTVEFAAVINLIFILYCTMTMSPQLTWRAWQQPLHQAFDVGWVSAFAGSVSEIIPYVAPGTTFVRSISRRSVRLACFQLLDVAAAV